MDNGPFANRLRKNARHLRRWAERNGLTAFRLYDRDIPEYPYAVDWYAGQVHAVEYPRRRALREGTAQAAREEVLAGISEVLEVPREAIHLKVHLPKKWGEEQYEKQGRGGQELAVEEQGLRFWVNLTDYLDTGLFLDHRLTRARVREEAKGRSFLNLFAYTGSFTVYAAAGGARETTTVDLSNTYLDWARRNLELNGLQGPSHRFIRADARELLADLAREGRRFELVVLDPPSFSASRAMRGTFEVQRDHPRLLADAVSVLAAGGVLYFSTNYQGFELHLPRGAEIEEITKETLPEDFRTPPHRCWRMRRKRG